MKNLQALEALITESIVALNYEFWGLVYIPQGRHTLVRIYIDSEHGITVDDCERVSRQVSAILDVEDLIKETYLLEVSSPGLDRPLFKKAQFERFINAKICLQLHLPVNNRRNFSGQLLAVLEDEILIESNGEEVKLLLANIAKANVLPENVLPKKTREKRT